MTARTTFETTVKGTAATETASIAAANLSAQETINQSGCNIGYNNATGNYAAFAAAVKASNAARIAAINAAAAVTQATIAAARDTLRSTGDTGAV
jgi:hypothetical protein